MLSVEVLVPWNLWGVELWEQWIHEDVEDELEWQLTDEVECKWQANWVHQERGGHHHIVVEGKSLVANEKLLNEDECLQPSVFVGALDSEVVEERWESNCRVIRWVVPRLDVHRVHDGVGHDGSQVGNIQVGSDDINDAGVEGEVRRLRVVEVEHAAGEGEPEEAALNSFVEREHCVDLRVERVPRSEHVVDTIKEAVVHFWRANRGVETPVLDRLDGHSPEEHNE